LQFLQVRTTYGLLREEVIILNPLHPRSHVCIFNKTKSKVTFKAMGKSPQILTL